MPQSLHSKLLDARTSRLRLKNRTPRVLLVANSSWYLWNFRLSLAEQLIRRGYNIVFAAPTDEYSRRLDASGKFEPIKLDRRGINPLIEAWTVAQFVGLLRRVRPDVLLTWTPKANIYGALAARWHNVPVVPNVSGLGHAFVRRGWLELLSGALYRRAFRRSQTILFQNKTDLDRFVNSGWTRADAARRVPGSGVDLHRFQPRTSPRKDPPFLFLFVGRMLADKGLRELVHAMRQIKQEGLQARLRLVGFIDYGNPTAIAEQELRSWEAEGLAEYCGPTDTIEQEYAKADCVVLPSSYREGIPRTILEAAACGLPVIATDTPGCRDAVIHGVTGFLCRPGDTTSLTIWLRKMLQFSPQARAAMGQDARSHMECFFSQELVFAAYQEVINSILTRTIEGPSRPRESNESPNK